MNKALKLTGIILIVLSAGTMFAVGSQTNWKVLKKASGIQITSAALYDGGHSCYFGDAQGDIYTVNRSGVTKQLKASGPVDSIVETRGGNGLGDFTFVTGSRVCTYNAKDKTSTDLNFPGPTKQLYYNADSGLYCSKDSNGAANSSSVYHYNGKNRWGKVNYKNSIKKFSFNTNT